MEALLSTLLSPLVVEGESLRIDAEITRGGLRQWLRVQVGPKTGERLSHRTILSLRQIMQVAGSKAGVGVVLDVIR